MRNTSIRFSIVSAIGLCAASVLAACAPARAPNGQTAAGTVQVIAIETAVAAQVEATSTSISRTSTPPVALTPALESLPAIIGHNWRLNILSARKTNHYNEWLVPSIYQPDADHSWLLVEVKLTSIQQSEVITIPLADIKVVDEGANAYAVGQIGKPWTVPEGATVSFHEGLLAGMQLPPDSTATCVFGFIVPDDSKSFNLRFLDLPPIPLDTMLAAGIPSATAATGRVEGALLGIPGVVVLLCDDAPIGSLDINHKVTELICKGEKQHVVMDSGGFHMTEVLPSSYYIVFDIPQSSMDDVDRVVVGGSLCQIADYYKVLPTPSGFREACFDHESLGPTVVVTAGQTTMYQFVSR